MEETASSTTAPDNTKNKWEIQFVTPDLAELIVGTCAFFLKKGDRSKSM